MKTLVIRTLYQGAFFKLLQEQKRHAGVETVDEMIGKNFSFYVSIGNADAFVEMELLRSRLEFKLFTSFRTKKSKFCTRFLEQLKILQI
jgi:hypothetical protein